MLGWLASGGTLVMVLVILYWRYLKLQIEGEEARTAAVQEKLDRADAEFRKAQQEERRSDEDKAASVKSDVDGSAAVEFLRDSFGPRKGS
jgi:hypothetical protein